MPRKDRRTKPKLDAQSYALLRQIDAHIRRYDLRGRRCLEASAGEALAGGPTRSEIDGLVRTRLVEVVRQCKLGIPLEGKAGQGDWTLRLSVKAMSWFWQDRMDPPPRYASRSATRIARSMERARGVGSWHT